MTVKVNFKPIKTHSFTSVTSESSSIKLRMGTGTYLFITTGEGGSLSKSQNLSLTQKKKSSQSLLPPPRGRVGQKPSYFFSDQNFFPKTKINHFFWTLL